MQRGRAVILFADVVGYSRLTERDEEGTHGALRAHLATWSDIIREGGGRVVNCAGDALLAEMPDAARALRSAVDAQRLIRARNGGVPVDRRLRFRVGINTGSVIADGDDLFGEGVNIAARLAGRADAGGICVSEADFASLRPPEDAGFEFLGDLQVRNIAKPIGAFKVLLRPEFAGKILGRKQPKTKPSPWAMAALASIAIVAAAVGLSVGNGPSVPDLEPAAGPIGVSLMEKPSVAVLPFENLTGNSEQNLLAESISDGLFDALYRFSDLYVVAPGRIEGPGMETAEIAERNAADLGVRYLLRGTLRRTADRVRITTQLFDTNGHRYAWGGRYDASLKDVFSSENGVIDTIATGVWAELTQDFDTAAWRNEAESAEAYRLAVIGLEHYRRFTPADNTEAKSFFRTAVTLDPEFLSAWAALGWSYFNEARYGWGDNPEASLARAAGLVAKVLAIDTSHKEAQALRAAIQQNRERTGAALY